MYIKSTQAKEVSLETFLRALSFAISPPDRGAKKRLKNRLGHHVICLNNETALSLLFRSIPGREPGMVVAIDSTLVKQSRRVVEASGFRTVVFNGEKQLIETLSSIKVDVLYVGDHFNQGGRKVHRLLKEFGGVVVVMQYRQQFRTLKDARADVMVWRPRGFTRASGGAVMIFAESMSEMQSIVRSKLKALETLSRWEVIRDMYEGLFGRVQSSRHISRRAPRVVRQLIDHRLRTK